MPGPQEKILRIGIIQGGKIIEEKLIRKRIPISFGSSAKNTFVLAASNVPKSFKLFQIKGKSYTLSFTDTMNGRVSVKDKVVDFAALKTQKLVGKKGDSYVLTLNDSSKGKIVIGDVTILFQFVAAPPEPVKPQLPSVAKGGWIKSVDWVYTSILAFSFIFHTGSIAYLNMQPIPEKISLDAIEDRFAKLIMPKKEKKEPPKVEKKKKEGKAKKKEEKKEEKKPEKKVEKKPQKRVAVKKVSAAERARKDAARRAELKKKVQGMGLLKLLGTVGPTSGEGGAISDVLSQGGFGRDLDKAMNDMGSGGVAIANSVGATSRKGGGGGKVAGIGGLKAAGGGKVSVGSRKAASVSGAVVAAAPEVDGSLDSKQITRVIKARIKSVKTCYERRLKQNPNLAGKILISFTISSRGSVSETEIMQNTMGDASVASCIVSKLKRWRFPKPDDGEVTVRFPFIFSKAG